MDIHSIRIRAVCSEMHMLACEREFIQLKRQEVFEELLQLKKKHKEAYRNQTKKEKAEIRRYRHTIEQRICEEQEARRKETEAEKKTIQDGLREWADVVFHYWDTRNAPSNELEYEAAMEMPYSQRKWLQSV